MHEINRYFPSISPGTETNFAPTSLDTLMQQQLSSHMLSNLSAFNLTENNTDKEETAKKAFEQFLLRYQQAVDCGKFIFVYSNYKEVMNRQFSADLKSLYTLMEPAEGGGLSSPSLKEQEYWLISLIFSSSDKEPPNKDEVVISLSSNVKSGTEAPPTDEKVFLSQAINSFLVVYKKTYEDLIEKTKEEMQKSLTVDWGR
jgi:hypothetical protein